MSNASISILSDKDLRIKMGNAARQSAINEFELEKAIDAYENVYWQALKTVLLKGPRE